MGSKEVLELTQYGPILAKRKGESLASLAKRQDEAFMKASKGE